MICRDTGAFGVHNQPALRAVRKCRDMPPSIAPALADFDPALKLHADRSPTAWIAANWPIPAA